MAAPGENGAQVHYRPARGDAAWWVAVEGAALAVLAPSATERTADAVWRRVGDGGIGAVLDALTGAFGTSLTAIPPFALAVAEPTGVRVAVRGPISVIVDGPDGPREISGEGVATWAERFIEGAARVTVTPLGAAAEDAAVPLRSGVALADLVVASLTAVTPAASAAPGAATAGASAAPAPVASVPAEIRTDAVPEPGIGSADPQISADAPAPDADAVASDSAAPEAVTPASEASAPVASIPAEIRTSAAEDSGTESAAEEISADAPAPDAEAGAPDTSADTWMPAVTDAGPSPEQPADEYDLLWGETVARPIAAAAIAAAPDEDASAGDAPADAAPAPAPPAPPSSAGSDDWPPAGLELGDHDGATISVAEARALRGAERERFESTDGVPARRPARGRIRLSTGRVVELERPVVIGRRPKSTRTSGSELPTLVAVDSPEQDISRSHVEIRAEGEHVLVTDLDTTNGTLLIRGGQDPVRLHPGEPTMVISADVLDLGDGITVTFEDLP